MPSVTPARRHACSIRAASAIFVAIGFSHSPGLPASAAWTTCSACKAFGEATKTPSTRVLEEVAEPTVRDACVVLLRERLRAVLIAAVDADELAAVGRGHRRRDFDVWMLARADDAPSERHRFSSVARVLAPLTGHRKNSTFASRTKRKFPGAAEIGPLIANTAISNLSPGDTARSASTTRLGMLKPWIAPGLGRPGVRGIAPLIQTSA